MIRAIGAVLAVLAVAILLGGSPAWAVVTNAQITAVGTDGTRIPIKSLKVTRGDTGLVSTTPDQDEDDDDRGGAALTFDTDEDRSREEVTISGVFVDPETGQEYEGSYTTTVPVGGQVDVKFEIDRATGTVTGQTTGTQTALQLGRPGPSTDMPRDSFGNPFVIGLGHMRLSQNQNGANVGNFDGLGVDLTCGCDTWEAITGAFFGAEPWVTDPRMAPTGWGWRFGIDGNIGSANTDFDRDVSTVQFRDIFPLEEGDPWPINETLRIDRDVNIRSVGGGGEMSYGFRGPGGTTIAPYGSVNLNVENVRTNTTVHNLASGGQIQNGFIKEDIDTTSLAVNVGGIFTVPIVSNFFGHIGGSVGGTWANTDYRGKNCASSTSDVACGEGNTFFNQKGVDRETTQVGLNAFGHAGFTYYFRQIALGFGGGFGTSPIYDIDYANQPGDTVDIDMKNRTFWKVGVEAKFNLSSIIAEGFSPF